MAQMVEMDAQMSDQYPSTDTPTFYPQPRQEDDVFQKQNEIRVIQEYNREENLPMDIKMQLWAVHSKSIKLGFWEKSDEQELYHYLNIIKTGHIMKLPKHKYTFEERQNLNQLSLLAYADFKRGIGMEKFKINERTLQATSITQNINGGGGSRKAGFMNGLKNLFM